MHPETIKLLLEKKEIEPYEFLDLYKKLSDRKIDSHRTQKGSNWGEPERIRDYGIFLRQILLHREILLLEGAFENLSSDNGYAMVLCIRGNYEATAALGYLHNRLSSLKQGNLKPEDVDRDINIQILGARDKSFREGCQASIPEAKQVMSMLDYADKSVSKTIIGESANKHKILRESYEFLCEFCHPNFLSNSMAFFINKEKGQAEFRHERNTNHDEAHLMNYLTISCAIFIELYDKIESLLPK